MVTIKYALTLILWLYVFYIFYLAIMSLYRAKLDKTITRTSLIIGYPILAVGALIDSMCPTSFKNLNQTSRPQTARMEQR